jgi:hypothetical protein
LEKKGFLCHSKYEIKENKEKYRKRVPCVARGASEGDVHVTSGELLLLQKRKNPVLDQDLLICQVSSKAEYRLGRQRAKK